MTTVFPVETLIAVLTGNRILTANATVVGVKTQDGWLKVEWSLSALKEDRTCLPANTSHLEVQFKRTPP